MAHSSSSTETSSRAVRVLRVTARISCPLPSHDAIPVAAAAPDPTTPASGPHHTPLSTGAMTHHTVRGEDIGSSAEHPAVVGVFKLTSPSFKRGSIPLFLPLPLSPALGSLPLPGAGSEAYLPAASRDGKQPAHSKSSAVTEMEKGRRRMEWAGKNRGRRRVNSLDGSWISVTGQTKSSSQAHHEKKNIKDRCTSPGLGKALGPHPGARPGVGARRREPGGRVFAHGTRPGSARNGGLAGGLDGPNPWNKTLAIGTWNVTSLGGKEPELVREVERYRLEIVGLTSTHSLGSGTQLLERGWTLHYSGVAQGERRRAGVGLLIAPQLSRHVLEFTPVNERVASLRLRVGDRSLAVVCAYGPNSSTEYPAFLDVPGRGT
ncbi:hypothetical protein L3Q82_015021 [Scortum barcoo]|uniref:Uncharacterized protein n=1 Tax=Scortum barcoo TaxID=214431 RepID=A0ACB8VSM6_9TELE|nr:hypothetical protein L3Q82_015021 [Scortum barcoo]